MSPRFSTNRIRERFSYSVQEVCDLLSIHKNTVREWLRNGLPKTDQHKPYLIYGSDLRLFLNNRQQSRLKKCAVNEFYCLRCRTQRRSFGNLVDVRQYAAKTVMLCGLCEVCETPLHKLQSLKNLPEIVKTFDIPRQQQKELFGLLTGSLNCYFRKDEQR